MIEHALVFLKDRLNGHFEETMEDSPVDIRNIVDDKGHYQIEKLGLTLVGIEEERVLKQQNAFRKLASGDFIKVNPEIKLNLFLLFSAYSGTNNYRVDITYLSEILRFFQAQNVFNSNIHTDLDPSISKLILELHTPTFEQTNNIWSALGAKYLPSVMYKAKMIIVQEDFILGSENRITDVYPDVKHYDKVEHTEIVEPRS